MYNVTNKSANSSRNTSCLKIAGVKAPLEFIAVNLKVN